jgi:hypothetical protein
MTVRRIMSAIAATVLISAAAGAAHAADRAGRPIDFTVKSEPTAILPHAGQTTTLDASKGRFGITLHMQQQDVRPSTMNDVAAGAYYRITPSLRVGGSVSLGAQDPGDARRFAVTPARPMDQPKVKLETAFKF